MKIWNVRSNGHAVGTLTAKDEQQARAKAEALYRTAELEFDAMDGMNQAIVREYGLLPWAEFTVTAAGVKPAGLKHRSVVRKNPFAFNNEATMQASLRAFSASLAVCASVRADAADLTPVTLVEGLLRLDSDQLTALLSHLEVLRAKEQR